MPEVNWVAAVVAGIVGFFPGALWYSPLMFLKPWQTDMSLTGHPDGISFGARMASGIALSLVSALAFAYLLGPRPTLQMAVIAGLAVGVAFITTAFAMQHLFEGRRMRVTLINGGYHTVQYLIYGLILGLWH